MGATAAHTTPEHCPEKELLFVDDSRMAHRHLHNKLKNWTVHHANNAAEALNKLQQEDIRIVITDINMPGMNGLELLGQIKKINPAIQVIVITATLKHSLFLQALEIGADDFILKPIDATELQETLDNALARLRRFNKVVADIYLHRRGFNR